MITIMHGDDIVSSRTALSLLKKRGGTFLTFEGESLDLAKIKQEFEGSLFAEGKVVVIEKLFENKRKEVLSYLASERLPCDVIVWEGRELSAAQLSHFQDAKILHFKPAQIIFTFLENVKPDNGQKSISLFHECLKTSEAQFLFSMIVRQFRLMLALADGAKTNIEEVAKLQGWQKERLSRQANTFTEKQLIDLYEKLFAIEVSQKTGSSPLSMVQTLDLFLLSL